MGLRRTSIAAALAILFFYAGLIISLLWFFDPAVFKETFTSPRILFSVRISILAATLSSVMALALAIPAAYALSRYRFPGRTAADLLLEIPLIVSPAALGAMLLIFFNNPLGAWIQSRTIYFVFAFAGIVLAQFTTILGIATRAMKTTFDEVPESLEMVARSLGASPLRVFFTVTLPLARRGILAAFVLSWAKAIGEFGATIMVAGSMAMRTETLPIAIYLRLASADIEGTVALIILLMSIGLLCLFIAHRLLREKRYA